MAVIAQVVDQHIEEAAILWLRRDRAVGEPHYTLADLTTLDEQLDAHLDGLRIAYADARSETWRSCERELAWKEPGEVFAPAMLALETQNAKRVRAVTRAAAHCYDCSRALVSLLGWLTEEAAMPYIDQLLAHSKTFQRRVGIAACAIRGRDPGERLAKAVESTDKLLKARALRAIGELARHDLLPAAKEALRSRDAGVKFSAAWSLARLSDEAIAIDALKKIVELQASGKDRALQLVLRKLDVNAAARWLKKLQQDPRLARQAVIGSGVVGTPDAIGWLLEIMATPALARVACEAFTMVTGIDLAAEKLEGNWPARFHAGPTEDPADNNVEMDPDENLPWPNRAAVADWWVKHRDEFKSGVRYLLGRPIDDEAWLEHVLRHGYQRQRAAAALELAIRRPTEPLFNIAAPAWRQKNLLGLK